ncbi:hypothetical protein I4F81_003056 [Pyropia yezoensis]|uniref:Uncharacterized protein n=1 Tax=Pyropia yezoensis TaxID=2788 RepID=A0ACC3BRI9_PYRYE|nr:hypothetical protein I4F81_003056 [Neopyropia yezoensis]
MAASPAAAVRGCPGRSGLIFLGALRLPLPPRSLLPAAAAATAALPPSLAAVVPAPTAASVVAAAYVVYYVSLDARVGGAASLDAVWGGALGGWVPPALRLPALVWAAGWVAQFVGHGVFEGRRPALVDSFVDAISTAPLFVFLEAVLGLGGLPALRHKLEAADAATAGAGKDKGD